MIDVTKNESHWILRLNRPDKANALTEDMLSSLASTVREANDAQVKALVLTGTGKVFSAGADLNAVRSDLGTSPTWEQLSGHITKFRGLTIAALNGTVAGGAMGMVLACDLRVAAPHTKFFYPVMKLGILPQPSDPARLAALVGPARAKLILMAGQKIDAPEALSWGLVDRIVEPADLLDTAEELAADVLIATASHSQAIKALIP